MNLSQALDLAIQALVQQAQATHPSAGFTTTDLVSSDLYQAAAVLRALKEPLGTILALSKP